MTNPPSPSFSPPYVIGIDAGTEAIKAVLFDRSGARVALGSRTYKTYFPRPGWAEQDPADWWNGLVGAVRDCLAAAPTVRPEEIVGLAADATCCTMLPMRRDGSHLSRCMLWMDVRASDQAQRIFASGDPALRYSLAGVNAEWMPPKMLWLRENQPEIYKAADVIVEFTDWIAYKLTGRFTLNISCVSHRWYYHLPSGGWPTEFYDRIGLGGIVDKFPKDVLRVGEVVGPLTSEAAVVLGLQAGIPIATCGADAFIGLLGQGVTEQGDMGAITGTSNVLSALSAQELHFPGIFGSFPDALLPGLNMIEGGQVSTGSILTWFRRNFAQGAEAEAQARGISFYELLDGEAALLAPGAQGLVVLDYFQGNRTPHTDSSARGMIWGLSLQSTRGHLWRALMEGIAYGMQDILETFSRNNFQVARVIASGGATRSPLFMQIYADVLGKPIFTTRETEASALGSAVVAATGAGLYASLAEASRSMVVESGVTWPDMARHEEYRFYLRKYQETYPRLKDLMREMTAHVAG